MSMKFFFVNLIYAMTLPLPATTFMAGIIDLYESFIFYLIIILGYVTFFLIFSIYYFGYQENKYMRKTSSFSHDLYLEFGWSILPSFVLIFISIPSTALLYASSTFIDPMFTIKIIGHQWFWSYEYRNSTNKMIKVESKASKLNGPYLLSVNNSIQLPLKTNIRLLVSSVDVIHSWTIPAFGIKIDAVPGRLNEGLLRVEKLGVYRGQCSELCGVGHGYMPIVINISALKLENK